MTINYNSVEREAVNAIHEYFMHGKYVEKPTDQTQAWEFMQEIFDSPADFTGIYNAIYDDLDYEGNDFYETFHNKDWYFHYTYGVKIIADNNLVPDMEEHFTEWWFAIAAIKVDYVFNNLDTIMHEAYLEWEEKKTKRYERITEMLKVWKEEEDKMWKQSMCDGWKTADNDNPNHAKALLLDSIINILEDPVYAEDRLEAYGF